MAIACARPSYFELIKEKRLDRVRVSSKDKNSCQSGTLPFAECSFCVFISRVVFLFRAIFVNPLRIRQ